MIHSCASVSAGRWPDATNSSIAPCDTVEDCQYDMLVGGGVGWGGSSLARERMRVGIAAAEVRTKEVSSLISPLCSVCEMQVRG